MPCAVEVARTLAVIESRQRVGIGSCDCECGASCVGRKRPRQRLGKTLHQDTGDVGIVERNLAAHACTPHDNRAVSRRGRERRVDQRLRVYERTNQHDGRLVNGLQDRARPVGGRQNQAIALLLYILGGRVAEIEAFDQDAMAFATEQHALGPLRMRVSDLTHAGHRCVPRRKRVGDRRRGANAIDHDGNVGRCWITRIECDVERDCH